MSRAAIAAVGARTRRPLPEQAPDREQWDARFAWWVCLRAFACDEWVGGAGSATDLTAWVRKPDGVLRTNDPIGHRGDQALEVLRRPVDEQHASGLVDDADPLD